MPTRRGSAHSFRQAFPGPGAPPPLDDDNRARLAGQLPILPPLAEQFLQPFERPALGAADGGHDQTVHHSQLQIGHATPWLERQERALTIQRDEIYAGQVLKDVAPNHDQGAPAPHGNQLRFVGDFTHRIKMAGYRIWEVPQAVVEHQSRPRGTWLFYYQIRNRWHFILKNYQLRTIVGLIPPLLIYEPLQFIVLAARGHAWTYLRAVAGLVKMLPALPRDRALAKHIRRRSDRELLISAPLVVRGDLATSALVRHGKKLYERFLNSYWHC